ncbi:sensor histidine kinase [Marinobacter alexandrii]|jgi:two-component system sensor histidine kinase UhpB|uniref:sensor histidine kinase n=2 Tax=Marinobacter alexandrii TaxID=2570351 RepID=UPI002ABDA653|nr:sensor histidine kinase [Marinobacter alexandrii]
MTAYRKTLLIMLAVFAVVYAAGALFYVQQAQHDVQRELSGAVALADNLPAPHRLAAEVVPHLRHLEPTPSEPGADGSAADDVSDRESVPIWFTTLIGADHSAELSNGWRYAPADEAEEIWEGFLLISVSYAIGMLLCFFVLRQMVAGAVRTLSSLEAAMQAVANGSLTSRLRRQPVQELDALASHFNAMAEALESEQRTVSRLMTELLQLQDREREHIARVLHDDLGQYLTGIRAQARSWVYDPQLCEGKKQQARELAQHCETMQTHFRHLLHDLHPLVMEQLGLDGAIQHLVEQWQRLSGLSCHLNLGVALPELSGEQQTHLYRFLQEALNNISRHARASSASLAVTTDSIQLNIEVCDNGVGGADLDRCSGLGIRSMRERARCLGGQIQFESLVGTGTRIRLAVPLLESKPLVGGVV